MKAEPASEDRDVVDGQHRAGLQCGDDRHSAVRGTVGVEGEDVVVAVVDEAGGVTCGLPGAVRLEPAGVQCAAVEAAKFAAVEQEELR